MIRRLLILIPLAAITFNTANCSSESAAALNARMWRLLETGDFDGFKALFPHTTQEVYVSGAGMRNHYRRSKDFDQARKPDLNSTKNGMTPLLWAIDHKHWDLAGFILSMKTGEGEETKQQIAEEKIAEVPEEVVEPEEEEMEQSVPCPIIGLRQRMAVEAELPVPAPRRTTKIKAD